jgi:integrase
LINGDVYGNEYDGDVAAGGGKRRPSRGHIQKRGNSYRVSVWAGVDPLTGKDMRLSESTTDEAEAQRILTRLLSQVDEQRNARTRATLGYTLDAWLDVHECEDSTRDGYRGYIERTIKPALGDVPIAKLGARVLEEFYAQLRRCRVRCGGAPLVDHRTTREHECRVVRHRRGPGRPSARAAAEHDCAAAKCVVVECKPHACKPMAASTIRQIHFVISGALDAAHRWEWIANNPAAVAKKPKQLPPQPEPPTPEQAARIVAAAWEQDEDWGTLVWLVMVTGTRRGELLALRWARVRTSEGVLEIRRNYLQRAGRKTEKDTKTHQMRRIALDETTLALLDAHRQRYEDRVAALRATADAESFVFSYEADHSRPCNPDGVTHRYGAMCTTLGIDSHLHALRHYSATELITAGVDIRTVAGRLGHGGGGTTTLRVYAAWVAESDKRAANIIAGRLLDSGRSRHNMGGSELRRHARNDTVLPPAEAD